jgi:hypothetical protein
MADIRRKLVIVGDGACGKVLSLPWFQSSFRLNAPHTDLPLDRLFQGHIPRGFNSPVIWHDII